MKTVLKKVNAIYSEKNPSTYLRDFNNIDKFVKNREVALLKLKLPKKSINTLKPSNIEKIKNKYVKKHIAMNLGDACMFNENIVHRSNKSYTKMIRFVPIIRLKSA